MIITQCMECKKYKDEKGNWIELSYEPDPSTVSSTYCPDHVAKGLADALKGLEDYK